MKKSDKISYRQKTQEELKKTLFELKKKLVETKAKFSTGNQKDTSVFKKTRHQIAVISTLIGEQEKNGNK